MYINANAQRHHAPKGEPGKCYAKSLIPEETPTKRLDTISKNPTEYRSVTKPRPGYAKRGITEWKEVVCEKDINSELIKKIQRALIKEGYIEMDIKLTGEMDSSTRRNLVVYQKEHYLPIGQLDLETITHLGIEVK